MTLGPAASVIHIADADLGLAEQALPALAVRYRDDAKRQANPIVRESFENSAVDCERVAERMNRFRMPPR